MGKPLEVRVLSSAPRISRQRRLFLKTSPIASRGTKVISAEAEWILVHTLRRSKLHSQPTFPYRKVVFKVPRLLLYPKTQTLALFHLGLDLKSAETLSLGLLCFGNPTTLRSGSYPTRYPQFSGNPEIRNLKKSKANVAVASPSSS